MLAVDQLHVRTGSARGILQSAARFVDSLSPADRVAFIAYPAPGPIVDFTDDRLRVKRAMQSVVGTQLTHLTKFNIGMSEAIDIAERSDDRVLFIVVGRECRGLRGQALDECEREIVVETQQMVARLQGRSGGVVAGAARRAGGPGPHRWTQDAGADVGRAHSRQSERAE